MSSGSSAPSAPCPTPRPGSRTWPPRCSRRSWSAHDLTDLIRVGDASALDAMMTGATGRIADQASKEYGLEVVDVRLRRLNYPEEVRSAVFEQIRSERRRVAAATRAEGESQARTIRSAADLERARTLAEAEADAARLVGEGEAQAARIANDAHAADPAFYQFLKTLETYRAALDARTTLVLSADSPFLRLLTAGRPRINAPGRLAGGRAFRLARVPVGRRVARQRVAGRRGTTMSVRRVVWAVVAVGAGRLPSHGTHGDPAGRGRGRPPVRRGRRRALGAGAALGLAPGPRPGRPRGPRAGADGDRRRARVRTPLRSAGRPTRSPTTSSRAT